MFVSLWGEYFVFCKFAFTFCIRRWYWVLFGVYRLLSSSWFFMKLLRFISIMLFIYVSFYTVFYLAKTFAEGKGTSCVSCWRCFKSVIWFTAVRLFIRRSQQPSSAITSFSFVSLCLARIVSKYVMRRSSAWRVCDTRSLFASICENFGL